MIDHGMYRILLKVQFFSPHSDLKVNLGLPRIMQIWNWGSESQ